MKKRFNIKEKWKAILCVLLVIGILGGTFGIIFTSVKKSSAESENEEITEPMDAASKIGLYRNSDGVLTYSYLGDYRYFPYKSLGFEPVGAGAGFLGAKPNGSTSWITVMYDRGTNPYLSLGKIGSVGDGKAIAIKLVSDSTDFYKKVFETDFSVSCSEDIGCEMHFYSRDVLKFSLKFSGNVLYSSGVAVATLNYGEWYNLRVEIVLVEDTTDANINFYIDNILLYNYILASADLDFSSLTTTISVRGGGCVLNLDNTYFSKG